MLNQDLLNNKSTVFDKLYILFFLFLPLIYSDKIIDPILIPRQIYLSLFLLILGFIIIIQMINKKLNPDLSFIKITLPVLFLSLIIIHLISSIRAFAMSESLYVSSKIMVEISFFLITTFLIIQRKLRIENLVKTIVMFGIISVLIACYQAYSLFISENDFLNNLDKVSSTFANKNLLSSILFLTIPFICCGFFINKAWKIISIISILLIIALLLIIQTRTVLIAVLISAIIFTLIFLKNKTKAFSIKKTIILSLIFFSLGLGGFSYFKQEKYLSRLTNTSTAYTRTLLWENSLAMAKENILLGVGPGNWQVNFPKYGMNKFEEPLIKSGIITYQRPHNDFLWVLCETGILGISIYILIFISSLFYLWKLIHHNDDPKIKTRFAILFSGIIGYMIIAFADFPLERIEHQIILFLIFSLVTANYYAAFGLSKKETPKLSLFSPIMIFFFATVCFSLLVTFKRYSGEFHTRIMKNHHHKNNWTQMIKEVDKSTNSFYQLDPMSAPLEWYKGVALFSLGNYDLALKSFENAHHIHPNHMHVLNNLASCYEVASNHEKAEEYYLKAISISPEFDEAILNLSAVYFNTGKFQKAYETINKCSISCSDPKYPVFLNAILTTKLDEIINKQVDQNLNQKLSELKNSQERLSNLFFECKRKNINFAERVLIF